MHSERVAEIEALVMKAAELDFAVGLAERRKIPENVVRLIKAGYAPVKAVDSGSVVHVVLVISRPFQIRTPNEVMPSVDPAPGVSKFDVRAGEDGRTHRTQIDTAGSIDLYVDLIRSRAYVDPEVSNGFWEVIRALPYLAPHCDSAVADQRRVCDPGVAERCVLRISGETPLVRVNIVRYEA